MAGGGRPLAKHRGEWTDFHGRLHTLLLRRSLVPRGASVVVAVSGGQDSVALGRLLVDLRSRWDWRLTLVYCDHGWRSDSAANGRAVAQLAATWGVPFVGYGPPVDRAVTTEATARSWRYDALAAVARQTGSRRVVTAHTASDRTETLLLNLMRGGGGDGLGALGWRRPLTDEVDLVRPLLDWTRAETAACCDRLNLPVWDDTTNGDRQYRRNRLRLDVLPYLRSHFNPQVDRAIASTAELLKDDGDCLETLAAALLDRARGDRLSGLALERQPLRDAPIALQRRALRQWLTERLGGKSPNRDRVEALRRLLDAPNRSQSDPFPGGAIARIDGTILVWSEPPSARSPSSASI